METLLDGVNHIALLTRDMERFTRFYQVTGCLYRLSPRVAADAASLEKTM